MKPVENLPHGYNPIHKHLQLLCLHFIRGHTLFVAEGGVQVVLPAQLVGRIKLVGQGQLVLAELCDFLLVSLTEELVLAVLDQLLLLARKQIQSHGQESFQSNNQEARGLALGGSCLLALLLLGTGSALGFSHDRGPRAGVAGHNQGHGVQFVG